MKSILALLVVALSYETVTSTQCRKFGKRITGPASAKISEQTYLSTSNPGCNEQSCSRKCEADVNCVSYVLVSPNICELYNVAMTDEGVESADQEGTYYDNVRCPMTNCITWNMTIFDRAPIQTFKVPAEVKTLADCRQQCKALTGCASYVFKPYECNLYNTIKSGRDIKTKSEIGAVYDQPIC